MKEKSVLRYKKLPKQQGIYKDLVNGKYQARKRINGKDFAETFLTVREAIRWRHTFNGVRDEAPRRDGLTTSTLGYVWQRMRTLHFPSLEKSTQRIWERRWFHLSDLEHLPMNEITSTVINEWIERKKAWFASEEYEALGRGFAGRCTLYNELNLFKTVFNWYKAEDEFEHESVNISCPIRKRHRAMAFFRDAPKKPEDKKIPVEAAFRFFSALPELYRDLALTQFFCAGRIGEVAGIQISNLYPDQEYLLIKDTCVWNDRNKTFEYLKPYPKNKEPRQVFLHPWLKAVVERRLKLKKPGCDFLFHVDGRPLNYCTIQSNYRQAQRKTGIPYTGTHCLRHGMATLARKVGGMGLDSVMAMTGHKDLRLAAHYSKIDGEVQKDTSLKIMKHIEELGLLSAEISDNVIPFRTAK